jgi:hypothetical protein
MCDINPRVRFKLQEQQQAQPGTKKLQERR